ncbi:MAG: nucleotidyl transferase AbiEii/AbiGii toxin family protein [Acidobacteriota bacterium]|nr:nucleotidyl transferase AbiEii/AbiGii toxin family protein [Acidobacteriota bacterium]
MKDLAIQTARAAGESRQNVLREYLQNYLLMLMQKTKMNESLYFVGGTVLRFLYRIRRFSEGIDFLAGKGWKPTDLSLFMKKIGRELDRAGYTFSIRLKDEKTVQRGIVRFSGLLYELGLSGRQDQNFSVHIEVNLNPPHGGREEKTIVNVHHPVLIRHLDLPSLFAGKLAAVLMRLYTKGRDIFDLF